MYIVGDNVVLNSSDRTHTAETLKSLDFLVVQDIFMNETAELADVVLPAASFAEKDGTFTNTDRHIQRIRKAIYPLGYAKPDWEIIAELSKMVGYPMHYESPQQIIEEISMLVPLYGGISYDRLEKGGLQWPCPHKDHPGSKFLFQDGFDHGKGKLIPIDYDSQAGSSVTGDSAAFVSRVSLYDSGTGTMTRNSLGLSCLMNISNEIKAGT
jgi:predicted molibdopterin-dependent oxidoreductase YjgC